MGQLHITKRSKCYFVIHTQNWTNIEEIIYDEEFWQQKMVKKLKTYVNFILDVKNTEINQSKVTNYPIYY